MENTKVSFEIPKNILIALNENLEEFINQIRLSAAIQFFRNHKLSLGKAAELANIKKDKFREELYKNDVPIIDYESEELEKEVERLKQC